MPEKTHTNIYIYFFRTNLRYDKRDAENLVQSTLILKLAYVYWQSVFKFPLDAAKNAKSNDANLHRLISRCLARTKEYEGGIKDTKKYADTRYTVAKEREKVSRLKWNERNSDTNEILLKSVYRRGADLFSRALLRTSFHD